MLEPSNRDSGTEGWKQPEPIIDVQARFEGKPHLPLSVSCSTPSTGGAVPDPKYSFISNSQLQFAREEFVQRC